MIIGNAIKEARKKKGLSQSELADLSGLNRNSIYNYETGKREPRIDALVAIAKALEISIDYFFETPSILSQVARQAAEQVSENDNPMVIAANNAINAISGIASDGQSILIDKYSQLNDFGKDEAIKRVSELTEIERYTKKEDNNE